MRRLWLQIAHTSAATVVGTLASVISLAITARVLGPSGRGLYAAVTAWIGLIGTLGTLSLGQVIVHHVAGRNAMEWLGEMTGTSMAIAGAVTAVGWAALAILYVASRGALFNHLSPGLLALTALALPFIIWADAGRYILNVLDALPALNWAQIASALTGLALLGVLLGPARMGVSGAVLAYVASAALLTALIAVYIIRFPSGGGTLMVRGGVARQLLRGSAQLHLNAIGSYLFTQGSVLVLNYYRPPVETGYYQLAMQLFSTSLIVSSAAGTVSFGLVAQRGALQAWPEQRRLMAQATLAVAALAVVAYFAAPLGITIVAGTRFLPAVPLFRVTLPALVGATFSTVMASQWIGHGLFKQAAALTLAIGVLSLGLDLTFVPRWGAYGALVSTLATYGISVIGNGAMAVWVQRRWRAQSAAA